MKRIHVFVNGKVQGVFFRAYTKEHADKLSIKGFVRNLGNENVEVIAEGDETALRHFATMLEKGPKEAEVADIKIKYEDAKDEFDNFYILR